MTLPNDYSRCTGTNCDRATQCQRFTDKGTGDLSGIHQAIYGCVGFIEVVKPAGQSVEDVNMANMAPQIQAVLKAAGVSA